MENLRNGLLILFISVCCIGCGGSPSGGGGGEDPPPDSPSEDTTPPSSPNGVEGESSDQQVLLNWNAVTTSDLEGYNLYRSTQSFNNISSLNPVNNNLITDTEFVDNDVNNGTTYYYRLTAVDDSDNESSTSQQVEVTPFSDPPDRPKN